MLSLRPAWSRAVVSGLINCTSQAVAILRPEQGSVKGTVPAAPLLGRERRSGAKALCSLANEAALRGSQRWSAGPSPLGIDSGLARLALPLNGALTCVVPFMRPDTCHAPVADLALIVGPSYSSMGPSGVLRTTRRGPIVSNLAPSGLFLVGALPCLPSLLELQDVAALGSETSGLDAVSDHVRSGNRIRSGSVRPLGDRLQRTG